MSPKPKTTKALRLTLAEGAREFRVHRQTLLRALAADGHETGPGVRYSLSAIASALYCDEDRARTRDLLASAKLKEQKYRRLAGELVDWSEVETRVGRLLGPIRTAILTAKATLPGKVNPSDPYLARAAIETWESQTLALLAEEAYRAAMWNGDAPDEEEDE